MHLKEFLLSKVFLKNCGYAILATLLLLWLTMVALSFYTHKGERFATPDFKGLTLDQVEKLAQKKHLHFVVEDTVFQKDVPPGSVVFQNPAAGHYIKSNRQISLTLASLRPDQVELPKLTDVSLRQARVMLESKGFALGQIELRSSEFNDLVLDQKYAGRSIAPGTRLDNGSTIDLVVGQRMGEGNVTIPSLIGLTLSDAREVIQQQLFYVGSVIYDSSIQSSEDTLSAIIWQQTPKSDSTLFVSPGSSIDLWLKKVNDLPQENTDLN